MSDEKKDPTISIIEVSSFFDSSYPSKRDGGKEVAFAKLRGRDDDDNFLEVVAVGPAAIALKATVNGLRDKDGVLEKNRHVVQVKYTAELGKRDGKEVMRNTLSQFTVLSGPSVEISQARKAARRSLRAAARSLAAADVRGAYLALEEFTARFAGLPAPSVDKGFSFDEPVDPSEDIEEEALARINSDPSDNNPEPAPELPAPPQQNPESLAPQSNAEPGQVTATIADQEFGDDAEAPEPPQPEPGAVQPPPAPEPAPAAAAPAPSSLGRRLAPRPAPIGAPASPAPAAAAPAAETAPPAPRMGMRRGLGA